MNVFATGKLAKVAVMTNLSLSTGSLIPAATPIYTGNKHVPVSAVYSALFGIMALIGKLTVVKLKSPEMIFLPISPMIYLPTLRVVLMIPLSVHSLPPLE